MIKLKEKTTDDAILVDHYLIREKEKRQHHQDHKTLF
jgi:hypothetical protein